MQKKWIAMLLVVAVLCIGVVAYAADEDVVIAPTAIYELEDGSFLFTDVYGKGIWHYEDGEYTRLAGNADVYDAKGRPMGGNQDGTALQATFSYPWDITSFLSGYAVSDTHNHLVRFFDWENQNVATVGGLHEGYQNGVGAQVSFSRPTGMVTLEDGSLLVADTGNNVIRQIATDGEVTLYAGTPGAAGTREGDVLSAQFNQPTGLYYADGVLYVADSGNHRICKIEDGIVSTVAGIAGTDGYKDAPATTAMFSWPTNMVVYQDAIYVADSGNGSIRLIENGEVSTFLDVGQAQDGFAPIDPRALCIIDGELWIGDVFAYDLFAVPLG